jgi:AcrR family transcriptional regulator
MTSTYESRIASSRLPPGPNGPAIGTVAAIQRSRILAAAVEAVDEVGYARLTVAEVIGRARVSRKTFYDVFRDREDCFLAAFQQALQQARTILGEVYDRDAAWPEGIRCALARLLMCMDEEPGLAKLCVVESLGAGERVLELRAKVLGELAAVVDQGRFVSNATHAPPELTAEGVVGAVFAVLHTRLLDGDSEPLTNLLGSLMSMIVLPYLGARAANRELSRPAPEVSRGRRAQILVSTADPLEGLKMRLTYRTVRVLSVIAEQPGASNREIAEGSGIVDQGQISKLLTRLARLALVENLGGGQERGASNAWHLTPRGAEVERATRRR